MIAALTPVLRVKKAAPSKALAAPREEKYKIWGGTVSCGEAKYIWSLAAERGAACGCREQPGALTHYSSRFTK